MKSFQKMSGNFFALSTAEIIILSGLLFTISSAQGSTPDAWAAHESEVVSACVKASHLNNPKPAGQIITFDDRAGFTALVIDGNYPQAHMKSQRGRILCLYDKKTRTPFVSEADSIVENSEP